MNRPSLLPTWRAPALSVVLLFGLSCGPGVDPAEKAADYFAAHRYAEAEEIYRHLLDEHPDDSALLVSLAGCLGALERYAEAESALARALELDPTSPEIHHNLGALARRRGDLKGAANHYARALQLRPGYPPSEGALSTLDAAQQLPAPSTPDEARAAVLAQQAREAAAAEQTEKALALLDKAEAIAPSFVTVYQYQANILYMNHRLEEAIAALQKGLAYDPDNSLLRSNLESLTREAAAAEAESLRYDSSPG